MSIIRTLRTPFAVAISLAIAGTAVRADEPGPGGTKVVKPVTGEQVYQSTCQACHMADGKGATGAATIPALAKNPALESSEYLVATMVTGRGAMPSFTDMLSPAQIAAVATHVRTHFGNSYKTPVTPADVTKIAETVR